MDGKIFKMTSVCHDAIIDDGSEKPDTFLICSISYGLSSQVFITATDHNPDRYAN